MSVACSPVTQTKNTGGSSDSSSTGATPTDASSPLFLVLKTRYETGTVVSGAGECAIKNGATTTAERFTACTISVPELRLYYSELQFSVGTANAVSCPFLTFTPYYFARSITNGVTFSGNYEARQCLANLSSDAACWGGAAKSIVTNAGFTFPQTKSVYFTPEEGNMSKLYKLDSMNTQRQTTAAAVAAKTISADDSWTTNCNVANNLDSGSRAASYAGNGVNYAGSGYYQDYYVACRDEYYEPTYAITVTINDADTPTAEGISNQVYDWN